MPFDDDLPRPQTPQPCIALWFAHACVQFACGCVAGVKLLLIVAAALPWLVIWYAAQGGMWLWRKVRA